jgi:4'-phosphopantetheinyl transferase EntD
MLEKLLPKIVIVAETYRERMECELFPEEELAVGMSVEKRRQEFIAGRACARAALQQLGIVPVAIGMGRHGEPLWPKDIIGSITHCSGYRACAIARHEDIVTLGIDAEINAPLPTGILSDVASPRECARLRSHHSEAHMDRVLFSAKEAIYKAWFPLTGRWLGFEDVDLEIDDTSFSGHLLVDGPLVHGRPLATFRGRWQLEGSLIGTAVALE